MLVYYRVHDYPTPGVSTRLHLGNTQWTHRVLVEIRNRGYRITLNDCTDLEIRPPDEIQNAQALLDLVA